MNITPIRSLGLAMALVLSSCSSTPETSGERPVPAGAPDWVSRPYSAYPEDRYLAAVGSGRDRNSAIDDAKKQMAQGFVVKVRSETSQKATSQMAQDSSGAVVGDYKDQTDHSLSLTTETFLRGAEVKEVAQLDGDYYALVAVDKLKARSGLLLEAQKARGKLDPLLDSLEKKFTQEKLVQARNALASLDQLYGEASALGMSALIDVAPYETRLNRIETAVRARREAWVFAVRTVKGAEFFERDLESCINDRGARVYLNEQAPKNAHRVEITVVERPQHQVIQGWTRIRFDVTAAILRDDGQKFRINSTQTETGRSREAVLESVADKLSQDLCDRLFARMSEAGDPQATP